MATEYEQHYNKIVFFLTTFSPRNKNWSSGLPCPTKDGNLVSTLAVHHVSISCCWIDILGTIFTAFLKISPRGVSKEIMCLFSYFAVLPKKSLGYIQVFLDGGLNQQRMGICDAVAVAKILNATLVIPHFEVNLVWQDSRYFTHEIFSVIIFILEKRSSDVIFL